MALVVYVDVDDTFVRSAGAKRMPIPAMIDYVRRLHAEGAELYCWSSGGAEYARKSAHEFGLSDCFAAYLPKPNVVIDDCVLGQWPRFIWVHPLSASDSIEKYLTTLK